MNFVLRQGVRFCHRELLRDAIRVNNIEFPGAAPVNGGILGMVFFHGRTVPRNDRLLRLPQLLTRCRCDDKQQNGRKKGETHARP